MMGGALRDAHVERRRRMTGQFLAYVAREVTLIPRSKVQQPAGGFTWVEGTPRPPQMLSVEPRTDSERMLEGSGGVQREVAMLLVGYHDAVIDTFDVFDLDGHRWEVAQVLPATGWDQRAEVIRLAG